MFPVLRHYPLQLLPDHLLSGLIVVCFRPLLLCWPYITDGCSRVAPLVDVPVSAKHLLWVSEAPQFPLGLALLQQVGLPNLLVALLEA